MEPWPIAVSVPVAWGDLDAFGHVNNTVYFRWFETARIALFAATGVLTHMEDAGIGPILASTQCDFARPVAFPDTIVTMTAIRRVGSSSFRMDHQIRSEAYDEVVATGHGIVVQVDYGAGASVPIGEALRRTLLDHALPPHGDPAAG